MGYSRPGASSLFPLDAVLNLPVDIYSHGHRSAIAFEVSKSSFSEAAESIKRYTVQDEESKSEQTEVGKTPEFTFFELACMINLFI